LDFDLACSAINGIFVVIFSSGKENGVSSDAAIPADPVQ